jgi:hypothetical protein
MAKATSTKDLNSRQSEKAESHVQAPTHQPALLSPQDRLLALQGAAGNHAVSQLLRSAGGGISATEGGDAPPTSETELGNSSGQPLEPSTRDFMESRFGHDFGQVRVHADKQAEESAQELNANAYTVGHDIWFGAGSYSPETESGRHLLAHELAHVIQQSRGGPEPQRGRQSAHEHEASAAASAVTAGHTGVVVQGATAVGVACDDKPMTPAHAGGEMGERDAAFQLGKMGFEIITGPGGPGGHKLTAPGIDIVAFNPKTGELWIVDNKASGGTSKVRDATAITKNLKTNLSETIKTVNGMADFDKKAEVLGKLNAALTAVKGGKALPSDVKLVITNAGGYHRGIGKRLASKGVIFVDVVGPGTITTRKEDIKAAKEAGDKPGRPVTHTEKKAQATTQKAKNTDFQTQGRVIYGTGPSQPQKTVRSVTPTKVSRIGKGLAQFFPAAMNALQDKVIRHSVARQMQGQWSKLEDWRRNHPNDWIVAVVSLQEWEHPDPTGQVARMVNYVEFFHGPTQQEAEARANSVLRSVVPKGWREVGPFLGWIAPTDSLDELKEKVDSEEGCFIATACYNSPWALEVCLLREFRNIVLRRSWLGRIFISTYYFISPPIAAFLWQHGRLRSLVRSLLLAPLIIIVRNSTDRWRP